MRLEHQVGQDFDSDEKREDRGGEPHRQVTQDDRHDDHDGNREESREGLVIGLRIERIDSHVEDACQRKERKRHAEPKHPPLGRLGVLGEDEVQADTHHHHADRER